MNHRAHHSEPDSSVPRHQGIVALDLFCGPGGVTTGLIAAGFQVRAGIDIDPDSLATYRLNHPEVEALGLNLATTSPGRLRKTLRASRGEIDVVTACAPCQTFSSLGVRFRQPNDSRNELVGKVVKIVKEIKPRAVVMENVPPLKHSDYFDSAVSELRSVGYGVWTGVVSAADFGVPQRRNRLVLVGLQGVSNNDVPAIDAASPAVAHLVERTTVRQTFSLLGDVTEDDDPLHRKRTNYPDLVARRIAAIPPDGGSRISLPDELQLECHKKLARSTAATSVYGRMWWDDVAPTLTTRCTTPSCGRFLHPEENRAITLREAACLQTFPVDYQFHGGTMSIQSQIGNAVPPRLAEAIGLIVKNALVKLDA